ncbi:MAG: hypothetical protein K9N01_14715 [Cephaloticoccus sp.]|nr:hypothetical protein [Cephaloticoccus sp.]
MKSFTHLVLILAACVSTAVGYAQESAAEKADREARVKARLAEHARQKNDQAKSTGAGATEVGDEAATSTGPEAKPADEVDPVTMMDRVTITSSRITELDVQIKKLDKEIVRAKKKIKPTELDETLNSDKTPAALLIFGGKTAGQRQSVAAERVNLMEAERDILEAMKHVRTKKEEAELNTQLNAFKTMRLQLDEILR